MAEPLANARRASLGARGKAFPHASLVDFGLLDEQPIDIDALGVFGVGYRRAHGFGDDSRGALGNKLENIERFLDTLAANLVHHQAHFARRDSDKFCDRACFHDLVNSVQIRSYIRLWLRQFRSSLPGAAPPGAERRSFLRLALRSPECA